jgi:exosortase/archaeosortase family protein|tara:strand:+ start:1120 stop:1515 length:396 start_codon:yes stop_codon:yes gene_type:complete
MGLFFETVWFGELIITNGLAVEFIKACIAGSAYFLLLILNLSTPKIPIRKRILMIFISFVSLLVLNVIRIVLLIFVFFYGFYFFDIAHEFFWYFMSTIFVILIWFLQVWYFKIKEIPFYSDLKYLFKKARG